MDIKMATQMARAMVTQYGMSDKLGRFLMARTRKKSSWGIPSPYAAYVERHPEIVDEEIHRMVAEGYEAAQKLLETNIEELHTVAKGLLEYETLSGQEIIGLLNGKPPVREFSSNDDNSVRRSSAVLPPVRAARPRKT